MFTEKLAQTIADRYKQTYDNNFIVVRSPGRVNIIGEHTDYNEGFVLPGAIDKAAYVAVGTRTDKTINLYATAFGESLSFSLDNLKPSDKGWPNYVLGVADQLIKRGYSIKGFNLVLDADVPIGAGLSSSAAVECATAFALDQLFELSIPKEVMAEIAQKAEHTFAGVLCGIMDQFASVFGKKDHVIQLDCRSLQYEYVPFKLEGQKILLLNTNVKHALNDSEYNTRRQQCEEGVALIQKKHPEVASLRDATPEMVENLVKPVDALLYKRCRYVVEENKRLLAGCDDLKNGNLKALGQKMFQTHDGLSTQYEVSCPELDFLVDFVRTRPEVTGARMMGGGFGGCTINLVQEQEIETLITDISNAYTKQLGKELTPYIAEIEDGTTQIM